MSFNISKEKPELQYLKINSSPQFEIMTEDDYSKEINLLPKMYNENINLNEERITKFFNNILPESKEGDILKINFALSSGCKKNKEISHQCLNYIMNMRESSNLKLTKDLAYKLSQIIKETFRRLKKYSTIKTYDELLKHAKDFLYKGGNIINKYMTEKKLDKLSDNNNLNYVQRDEKNTIIIDKIEFNKSSEDLPHSDKSLRKNKIVEFKFKDIKSEKKKSLPAEMRCLIKKFSTIKNLQLSINNKTASRLEEFNLDITDIQNTIIILYNSEWLFQNLLEIEIDLSNSTLLTYQFDKQKQYLQMLSELLNRETKLTVYHFGLNKDIIFNPYQLSNFYASIPKLQKDNFLYLHQYVSGKKILTYKLHEDDQDDANDNFINSKKYIFEMIVVYAYFLLKLKNIRICYLIYPMNYKDEIIKILKSEKIMLDEFNFLGFFKENFIHHFTIDFNSLDSLSFQKVLNFISQNGTMKIFRINFFKSEEYFRSEILYKILQINDNNYQGLDKNNFHYDDDNRFIYDLKINESLDDYILRKLYDKFQQNISHFFYLISIRTNINELSLIFDIPNILFNNNYYVTLILKLILNILIFINSPMSNIAILSIQAESLVLNGNKCIYLQKFFDKLTLYKDPKNKVKSLTIQSQIYNIINIHKLIPFGIEYLSLGAFDLKTFIRLVDYLTSIDFAEHSKLKKIQINLNNSIFKYEQCKDYLEQLLIEHPRNLAQISIYTNISIKYIELKTLLLKTNYNIIENIFFSFNKQSLKDDGYKEKLKSEEYNKNVIIDRNFMDLFCVQRKKKNTKMIIELMNLLGKKINKEFHNYNIFMNIEKFIETMEKKINIIEFK